MNGRAAQTLIDHALRTMDFSHEMMDPLLMHHDRSMSVQMMDPLFM